MDIIRLYIIRKKNCVSTIIRNFIYYITSKTAARIGNFKYICIVSGSSIKGIIACQAIYALIFIRTSYNVIVISTNYINQSIICHKFSLLFGDANHNLIASILLLKIINNSVRFTDRIKIQAFTHTDLM